MKRELITTGMVQQVRRMLHNMALMMKCRCHSAMEHHSALADLHLIFRASQTEATRTELH